MRVPSLGREDPLEEGMTTHSSILAQRIPWTDKPGGHQFMGSQRVGYNKIQPVPSKGDQSWVFFGRNDAKAATPVLWPPHAKC